MSQTVTTKLRGFVAAFTALVLTLALIPTAAFATLWDVTDGREGQNNRVLTGSILISGITADDLYDSSDPENSGDLSITLYKIASIQVDDVTNVADWVAADGSVSTTSGSLAAAIANWASSESATTAAAIVSAMYNNGSLKSGITEIAVSTSNSESADADEDGTDDSLRLLSLEPGIYYINIVDNTYTTTYQTIIVSVEPIRDSSNTYNNNYWTVEQDVEVDLKTFSSSVTSLTKTLVDDTSSETKNVYAVGDTLLFSVQFTLTTAMSTFVLTDNMTGLEYGGVIGLYTSTSDLALSSDGTSLTGGSAVTGGSSYFDVDTSASGAVYNTNSVVSGLDTGDQIGYTLVVDFGNATNIQSLIEAAAGSGATSATLYLVYTAEVISTAGTTGIYNSVGSNYTSDPSDPGTGPGGPESYIVSAGISIFKYDAANYQTTSSGSVDVENTTGLGGAEFTIYSSDPTGLSGTALANITIGTYTTEADGYAYTGLLLKANTTYYVQETSAPSGYELLTGVGNVTTSSGADVDNYEEYTLYTVSNTRIVNDLSGIGLPSTGGMGTILFTIVGVLVMAGAAYLIIRSRKQQLQD